MAVAESMNWLSNPDSRSLVWLPAVFVLSFALTALAIRYAQRNGVIDLPGQRRSHSTPTPRGAGIGLVVAMLLGSLALAWAVPGAQIPLRLMASVALVAAIGWIDDHRPQPAWLRLTVQAVAVAIWLTPLLAALLPSAAPLDTSRAQTAGIALLLALLMLWSINLHNFMDGIDGLLALQGVFVLAALMLLCLREPGSAHALQMGLWAAAIAGFVPFNFPRARAFMGDVGSGAIGLLVAVAIVWQTAMPEVAAASGFVAASAFVTDATCTLLSRVLHGRRWYSAHREHLYQWMARSGMSHARVVAWYMGWNLLVVVPVLCLMNVKDGCPDVECFLVDGRACALVVYVAAVALWICGKRWCLHKVQSRRHATA